MNPISSKQSGGEAYIPSMRNALILCKDELVLAEHRYTQRGDKYFAYSARNAITKAELELVSPAPSGEAKSKSCLDPTLSQFCTWPKCILRADGWHSCVPNCPTDHAPTLSVEAKGATAVKRAQLEKIVADVSASPAERYEACYKLEILDLEDAVSALRQSLATTTQENEKLNEDLGLELANRDRAEEVADTLTSIILGEDVDWPDHDSKWEEAMESGNALRASLATAQKERDELRRKFRWNIETTDLGFAICKNEHEKHEPCQMVEYVPRALLDAVKSQLSTAQAERDELKETVRLQQLEVNQKREANAALLAHKDKDFWIWQGDDTDKLESLGCYVLIHANQLRATLKEQLAAKGEK